MSTKPVWELGTNSCKSLQCIKRGLSVSVYTRSRVLSSCPLITEQPPGLFPKGGPGW